MKYKIFRHFSLIASFVRFCSASAECRKDKEFLAPLAPSSGSGVGGEGPNFKEIQPLTLPSPHGVAWREGSRFLILAAFGLSKRKRNNA